MSLACRAAGARAAWCWSVEVVVGRESEGVWFEGKEWLAWRKQRGARRPEFFPNFMSKFCHSFTSPSRVSASFLLCFADFFWHMDRVFPVQQECVTISNGLCVSSSQSCGCTNSKSYRDMPNNCPHKPFLWPKPLALLVQPISPTFGRRKSYMDGFDYSSASGQIQDSCY